jgi:Rrf2 family protein
LDEKVRLTKKAIYAVQAMCELAANPQAALALKTVSARRKIPLPFLSQIFHHLKKSNLVKAMRGPTGGYLLVKNPDQVYLQEIFEALGEFKHKPARETKDQTINLLLHRLEEEIKKLFTQLSLEALLKAAKSQKQETEFSHRHLFHI